MNERAITRRTFVGGLAGATASLAIGEAEAAARSKTKKQPARRSRRVDVVVVGAGLSGLIAARDVHRAGRSVLVLEARGRVGGRILNHSLGGGEVTEAGAEFVGPTMDNVYGLAQELKLSTFPAYSAGSNVSYLHGQRSTYSAGGLTGNIPPDLTLLPDLSLLVGVLDSLSKSIPLDAPWTAANAGEYDRMTLDSYIAQHQINLNTLRLAATLTQPLFGAEPRDVSLLYTLFYIASAGKEGVRGTLERLIDARGGAQQDRIVGGTQLLPLGVAHELGKRVLLRTPVTRIVQNSGSIRVQSAHTVVHAKRAIVALAPSLCQQISFHPFLGSLRSELQQRLPLGALMKAEAVYARPFWRDAGLNGQTISDTGTTRVTFDSSPPSGTPGVLMGFVGGDELRRLAGVSAAARRQAVLACFARYYGPQALNPRDYFEMNWSTQRWTRGCPVGLAGPGTLTEVGPALREPIGRIHWAGTETSEFWNGYMEGAIRAGRRAAGEALAEL